jgi:hypothetical protein
MDFVSENKDFGMKCQLKFDTIHFKFDHDLHG